MWTRLQECHTFKTMHLPPEDYYFTNIPLHIFDDCYGKDIMTNVLEAHLYKSLQAEAARFGSGNHFLLNITTNY